MKGIPHGCDELGLTAEHVNGIFVNESTGMVIYDLGSCLLHVDL
jgi:hypothetical protein